MTLPQPVSTSEPLMLAWNVTKLTVNTQSAQLKPANNRAKSTSRWRTREFYVYYAVIGLLLPWTIYTAMQLSSASHPNYYIYARRLRDGWMGRKIDITDAQYRQFRSGLPPLICLASIYLLLSHVWRRFNPSYTSRLYFIACLSLFTNFLLHGLSTFKILLILYLNFTIVRNWAGTSVCSVYLWTFNVAVLFSNQYCNGYQFEAISSELAFLDKGLWAGLIARWHIGFNISILRLLSFGLDCHWHKTSHEANLTPNIPYTFINYLAYVLYPPLYIAGPIITFNDFFTQIQHEKPISLKSIATYTFRWLICFLTMEWILHHIYVVAIKDTSFQGLKAWTGDSPFELAVIGLFNLVIIWLKLLLPWRFFRLWALLDGIDPPENMIRCMHNNYSVSGFWRSWHRSYNLWIIRYIYVPLGGTKNALWSTAVVFTFVAFWHDLSLRLLAWGWVVSILVLPELLCRRYLATSDLAQKPCYRHLAACGGAANIFMMLSANLIGFAIGLEGIQYMWKEILGSAQGLVFCVFAFAFFFAEVQVMFEYREEEARQSIDRKC